MTLHVFADALGLYPRYVVENIRQYGYMDENRFINLSEQVTYAIPEITQLADSIRVQCRWVTAWEGPMHRVVFHPYQASCYDLLHALKRKFPALRVGWVFWSFELYNRPSVYMQLLGPFSTQFYQNSKPFYHRFVKGLKQSWPGQVLVDLLYRVFDKALVSERLYLRSIRQVDDFYALLEEDFHYLQQVTPFAASVIYHRMAYLSLERMLGSAGLGEIKSEGNTLMVGHAAGIEGNQFEVLEKLNQMQLARKIFIPLAYGDAAYRDQLAAYATSHLQDVEILLEKMTPEAYYQKLREVGFCVMNVRVQQGIGNITALLWMGCKLFLSEQSSTYREFKKAGMHIYTVEHDFKPEALETRLTDQETIVNRQVLVKYLGEDSFSKYWSIFK